ncbi:DUF2325 domain-containing protein (plasmid) [Brevibacillus halotolerans]|nr:DUF2325 domain-containing protein [Brevibacillus halotolerans]
MIGNEPSKAEYQQEVERRGGKLLWADAKDELTRIKSMTQKADLVVFLLRVSGHTGMKHIKQYCKILDKPFVTTWSLSSITIAKALEKEIIALRME